MEELEQEVVEIIEEVEYVVEKKELPKNIDVIAAAVATVAVFFPFFSISVFGYSVASISGISLLSGADLGSVPLMLFGLLVVGTPILVLVSCLVDILKPFKKVFSIVFPVVSLVLIIVTYMYVSNEFGAYGDLNFGLGFWLYVVGCAGCIAIPFIQGEKIDVNEVKSAFVKSSAKIVDLSGELFSTVCPTCGTKNGKNKNFCMSCGKELPKTKVPCTKCNEQVAVGAAFCPKCGEKMPVVETAEAQTTEEVVVEEVE